MSDISAELENARRDLIDVGFRNSLLNYRVLKSKGVEIVDELPDEVYNILVSGSRRMSFLPAPEDWAEAASEADPADKDLLFELLEDELASGDDSDETNGLAARHTDTKLQTPYREPRLERRLLNTFYAARTSIEEQGVNTLYIALGMLRWREAEQSSIDRASPLILVPVELSRTDVRGKFRVSFTGDEVGHNLSLEAKLKSDFGISIPTIESGDDITPSEYFAAVSKVVSQQKDWAVDDHAVALGFFSFAKFLMYKDLEQGHWPEDENLVDHEVIGALLADGFEVTPWSGADAASIDDILDPKEIFHIRDADSSQTAAILRAHEGQNLVIQGPPGTGKSQTISNLIAEGIVRKKKILFVSEKMAALEVVKRRLENDGIGDACLELHSNKTNKKAFLADLESTVGLGVPKEGERATSAEELRTARDRLNEYCRAVNEPITSDRQSAPIRVFGHLRRLERLFGDVEYPKTADLPVSDWSWADLQKRVSLLRELETTIQSIGEPIAHPFWGTNATVVLPRQYADIRDRAATASKVLNDLQTGVEEIASSLDLPVPSDFAGIARLNAALKLLIERPSLGDVDPASPLWAKRANELRALIDQGCSFGELHREHDNTLIPEAWNADVHVARRTLIDLGNRWWRFAVPGFWRARKFVRTLCREKVPADLAARIELLDAIGEARNLAAELTAEADLLEEVLRKAWKKERTQWRFVGPSATWCIAVHEALKGESIPQEFLGIVSEDHDRSIRTQQAARLEDLTAAFTDTYREALEAAEFDEGTLAGDVELAQVGNQLAAWTRDAEAIQQVARYNHVATQVSEQGLEALLAVASTWPAADHLLAEVLQYEWFNALAERAYRERSALAGFEGRSHEAIIKKFQDLDEQLLKVNRAAVARVHWDGLPPKNAMGQMGTLLHEFSKKRRHLPIRKVMDSAGMAVQAIKPVFMMSPLSVATYLPPGSVHFDMVIFDEASQVRPVEALGAIARAKQAVVVGDSKQLPPTTFFDKIAELDDDEEESPVTRDMESVLGVFTAQGAPGEMLRWHYRSKHESLIAVSNHEFYDGKLVTFPTPIPPNESLGVTLRYLPETNYERGARKAYNRDEAAAVAAAVMAHAKSTPDLTLGVAAFSKSQAQVLLDHVEIARRRDPSLESFFSSHPDEPFFVKNLENVQGDERDVILISIGYGKDADGYLAHNFGPLNRDGGERRLNVLITRARRRCEVFTNFLAGDIDLSRSQSRGVVALKRYLSFAETGNLDLPQPTGGEAESPFEEEVAAALQSLGHEFDYQVGSGGFRIDLAVRNGQQAGSYILGIECDGATYHSARWARDRDRIRQRVLEGLGWRIHRIWSTDWFRNPERELRRLEQAIEVAQMAPEPRPPVRHTSDGDSRSGGGLERGKAREPQSGTGAEPYQLANLGPIHRELAGVELHEVPPAKMAKWVLEVVEVEAPVHTSEVARRITDAAGMKRTGRRIVAAVRSGIQHAKRKSWVKVEREFLWSDGQEVVPRDRSQLPQQSRKIELIAPEEITAALLSAARASVGIRRDDALRSAAGLLGYARVTDHTAEHIDTILDIAISNGDLLESSGFITLPS